MNFDFWTFLFGFTLGGVIVGAIVALLPIAPKETHRCKTP